MKEASQDARAYAGQPRSASEMEWSLRDRRLRDVAGFVLAGGKSSRMGTDKALVQFRGQPLIANALAILNKVVVTTAIAGSRSDLSAYGDQIPDTFKDAGPLGGVHAALSSPIAKEYNLFLPVDMPLIPPWIVENVIQMGRSPQRPVVVCSFGGKFQPFPVALHKAVLPHIEELLIAGNNKCRHAWRVIPRALESIIYVVNVEEAAQRGRCHQPPEMPPVIVDPNWFESANTPDELARLHEIAGKPSD